MNEEHSSLVNNSPAQLFGTALIVSEDAVATSQFTEALKDLGLSIEVYTNLAAAVDWIERRKLEVGIIDFGLGDEALMFFERVRASASNRTAVTVAITSNGAETARAQKAGLTFALERPLTPDSIRYNLKAAYGLIARACRR